MSEKLSKPPRRGRRNVVFASLAAVAAMLVASVGTATAQADGVGTASARGTIFPSVTLSAITNCDETQNTRPFYVRYQLPGDIQRTFKRTSTATSTCDTQISLNEFGNPIGLSNVNEGTGAGMLDGTTPATLKWRFQDSPDAVTVSIKPVGCNPTCFSFTGPATQPLNGSPGGVWVFGTLPWPSG